MTWIRSLTPRQRLLSVLAAVIVSIGAVTAAAVTGGDGTTSLDTSGSSTTLRSTTSTTSSSTTSSSSSSTSSSSSSTTTSSVTPGGSTITTVRGGGSSATTKAPGTTSPTSPPPTAAPASCNTSSSGAPGQLAAKFCAYRAANDLATMQRTAGLDAVAQEWANRLAADHNANPSEFNLPHRPDQQSRILAACSSCTGWAENAAYATSVDGIWSAWLGSSTHLANIRNARAGEFGIGVATSNDGYLFAVQNFGRYP